MTPKIAFITGITGQDGSYLTELLLSKGYEIHGLVRRTSTFNRQRIDRLYKEGLEHRIHLHYGDITDGVSLIKLIKEIQPDEIYNLAAMSHVMISYETPIYTAQATGIGTLNLLEAVRICKLDKVKIYHASTSELFSGKKEEAPQNENTPFNPQSPYGVAKLYAHKICEVYRKAYGMFICCGILFNHESPRRSENFVTRKITIGVSRIARGEINKLYLGNLDAIRDWGYAKEYVEGMWLMLQQDKPDDFVLATSETHSVREFCKESFDFVGLDYKKYIEIDKTQIRPNEVNYLCGDYLKAKEKLGWQPKVKFKELVKIMMEDDLKKYDTK